MLCEGFVQADGLIVMLLLGGILVFKGLAWCTPKVRLSAEMVCAKGCLWSGILSQRVIILLLKAPFSHAS